MNKNSLIFLIIIGFFTFKNANAEMNDLQLDSLAQIVSGFKNPPVDYRSAPLWVWNNDITEEEIDQQLIELKAGGMGGVFIHPRPGLITPYLSERWFSLCRYAVDKAKESGMKVWLYDENSYPSGFAGGHVPAEMPESYNQGQGLEMHHVQTLPKDAQEEYYLVLKNENSDFLDITHQLQKEENKRGDYYIFNKSYYQNSPWFGGYSYVDLLYKGVTEKFIELTMSGYEKTIGEEFGNTVPGIFTDEPNISPPGGIRWTPALFAKFRERWGYDLKTKLPSLFNKIGDWKLVRHNYYSLLLEMFIDKWSKPWFNYCEEHQLNWTGHYWEHGWPNPSHGADNMAMYAWHQIPAIDILMNQYSETVNAQFGNVRAVKELSSAANQMGRVRKLSETYGAGGWDLRFEDMKRIGDWEYVLGVNFLNQHLSYITIAGARKRDHPLSFSYHEPWWDYYKELSDYFARLSLVLSSGKQINRILVLEPTTSAWMYYSPTQLHDNFNKTGTNFQNFVVELERNQVEYDLGSENIIKNNGEIINNEFVVGECAYNLVVIPPDMENLDQRTATLLIKYLENNGKILSFGNIPQYIDGSESTRIKLLTEKHSEHWITANTLTDSSAFKLLNSNRIQFHQPGQITGKLFHHRRELKDGDVVFLVNTSLEEWASGSFTIVGKSAIELNPEKGEIYPYPAKYHKDRITVNFDIPPAGSLLLFIDHAAQINQAGKESSVTRVLTSSEELKIERLTPNILTLDYCDLKLDGKFERNLYFFEAADKIFKHYGFDGNPWSRAVQYKTSITDRDNFPDDSGFKVQFNFAVEQGVDKSTLQVVVERPELWKLSVNDKTIEPDHNKSWLDRAFGVYEIGNHVKTGKNKITLTAAQMTVHSELEPIYVLGNFGLKPEINGWELISDTGLALGSWIKQGLPFYSDGISYTQTYQLTPELKRYIVKLTNWYGSIASVKINGNNAGIIAWEPYELDVTDFIKSGNNEVSVTIYGTLKNLLGPHHIGKVRGTAWPASFQSAPKNQPGGNDYDLINYGLFEDFILIENEGSPQKVYMRNYRVAKPVITSENTLVLDSSVTITLATRTEGAEIRYTLDGSPPEKSSTIYTAPITINKSATLKALAIKEGMLNSKDVQRSFYIVDSRKNGILYLYYEGYWGKIPDFNNLSVTKKGRTYDFSLDRLANRKTNFALQFRCLLEIQEPGEYTFHLLSNDGSKLIINDTEVVNNDGLHTTRERQGILKLEPGLHPIKLLYFDGGGSHDLQVMYKGPGIQKQLIPPDKLIFPDF